MGSTLVWFIYGCGSKNRYQNGTLVSGNMGQNLRKPLLFEFEPHPSPWHIESCQEQPGGGLAAGRGARAWGGGDPLSEFSVPQLAAALLPFLFLVGRVPLLK